MARPAVLRASLHLVALLIAAGTAGAQRIQMPVGYRLTWIGARWNPGARVIDPAGRPVAAPLTYRIADPAVASVNNRGEVTARKPGNTRLWAVSGRDSASALIVVEQWPAHFTFSPATVRLDAIGARQPIRVLASDSAGVAIVGGTSRTNVCRSVNDRVATLKADSVVSVANGTTWIRCSERGLADSIRIDVQQRAVATIITNKPTLRSRVAGDTFSVRVSTRDRLQKEIPEALARPTWVSLTPSAVSVDPLTGKARAVNGGEARIIAQVGDVADSVTVTVTGSTFAPIAAPVAAADTTTKSKAQLIAQEIFVFEAETTFVQITAVDSAGGTVGLGNIRFQILDTTIAARIDTARIVGKKSGQAKMVVRYAGLVDTADVNVRTRSSTSTSGTGAAGADAGRSAFVAPSIPDSARVYQALRKAADDSIRLDPNTAATRQNIVLTTNAVGALAEHLVKTDAGVIEDRSGPLYGGAGSLLLFQRLEINGALRLGTLTSVDTIGEPLDVIEFDGSVGYFPIRNIGLRGGVALRGESSELATQTWMIPKVSLVTRFGFIGDIVSTYAAVSVMPKAVFTGLKDATGADLKGGLFSRGGEAGLEFRRNPFAGSITYFVEQLSFDENPRVESFSAIRIRLGFNVGR